MLILQAKINFSQEGKPTSIQFTLPTAYDFWSCEVDRKSQPNYDHLMPYHSTFEAVTGGAKERPAEKNTPKAGNLKGRRRWRQKKPEFIQI